jgi:two-component system, NarL family, sensor histidine kinase UhpB
MGEGPSKPQVTTAEIPETLPDAAPSDAAPAAEVTRRARSAGLPLLWRLFLVNTSVLVVVALLLALTPVTIHAPVRAVEVAIIAAGLLVMVGTNLVLLRRTLAPLRRLTELMRAVDPMQPGRRLTGVTTRYADVAALTDSFNLMLNRLEFERRESARRALAAQEHERLRIARELHDEVGQTLTAIALEAERSAQSGSQAERASWTRVAEWSQRSVEDLRRIARELRPEALDDLGLINAFIVLCTRVGEQSGIEVERRLPERLPPHSREVDLVVYRVAQESLTNVMRHADASSAVVSLESSGDQIVLTVTDDGRGIANAEQSDSKTGVAGMRERALLIGGALSIRPGPGAGTEVKLSVPLWPS